MGSPSGEKLTLMRVFVVPPGGLLVASKGQLWALVTHADFRQRTFRLSLPGRTIQPQAFTALMYSTGMFEERDLSLMVS